MAGTDCFRESDTPVGRDEESVLVKPKVPDGHENPGMPGNPGKHRTPAGNSLPRPIATIDRPIRMDRSNKPSSRVTRGIRKSTCFAEISLDWSPSVRWHPPLWECGSLAWGQVCASEKSVESRRPWIQWSTGLTRRRGGAKRPGRNPDSVSALLLVSSSCLRVRHGNSSRLQPPTCLTHAPGTAIHSSGLDRNRRPDKLTAMWRSGSSNRTANIMQHKRFRSVWATLLVAVLGSTAGAHPGHGTTEPTSPAHAAEPVHLLPVLLLAGVVALGGFSVVRRYQQARARK